MPLLVEEPGYGDTGEASTKDRPFHAYTVEPVAIYG
jgi:hypothetical protein